MAEENICSYLAGLLTKARFFFFLLLFTLLFLASCLNSTSFGHRQKQKKEGKSVCDVMAMVGTLCLTKMKNLRISHNVNWFRTCCHIRSVEGTVLIKR